MKKGQIYEGVIERVDFPNKGIVYIPEEDQYVTINSKEETVKEDYWKCWQNRHWRQENLSVVFSRPVAAVCTRRWIMKSR